MIHSEFVDAVEIKTGGYRAEYGRALGGIISAVTKSGGNAFHGGGFVYYDSVNTAAHKQFKAGDSVVASMQVVDGQRFDYGVDLGGFLLKDRLWFFGAYNRASVQAHVSQVQSFGNVTKDDRFPFEGVDNFYSGKLTWNAGPSTSVVGTVFADPTTTSGAAGADPRQGLGETYVSEIYSPDPASWYSTRYQGGTDYGLRFNQLFGSHAIVTLQASSHSDRNSLTPPDGIRIEDDRCSGGTPQHACDFPGFPYWIKGGYGLVTDHSTSSRRQFAGAATLYAGSHEVKVGGDYMDGQTDALVFFTGGQQVYIGNEFGQLYYLHDYFAVSPEDPTPVPQIRLGAQVLDYSTFLQDTWSLAQGLTINAGLRWDGERIRNYLGETVLAFNDEWQPRVGVAWDPWRNGATKIYASAGRFSYALPTVTAAGVFGRFFELYSFNTDPVRVDQDPSIVNHSKYHFENGGVNEPMVDSPINASYQDELTVGVERLLEPTLVIGLKGTYRRLGRALETRCDFYESCAFINPGSIESTLAAMLQPAAARGRTPTISALPAPARRLLLHAVCTAASSFSRASLLEATSGSRAASSTLPFAETTTAEFEGLPDPAGHHRRIQLARGLAQRLRDPRSGSPLSPAPGRLLCDAVAPYSRPADLRRVGRPVQPAGLLESVFLRVPGSEGYRGAPAHALGGEPDALLSDRHWPGDRHGGSLLLQSLQQADRRRARRDLGLRPTARLPRHHLRSQPETIQPIRQRDGPPGAVPVPRCPEGLVLVVMP